MKSKQRRQRPRMLSQKTELSLQPPRSTYPLVHFFTKLVFAAPESGLPSLLTALSSQHLFMKLVFAAPASGLPSLPTAFDEHVASCAIAEPHAIIKASAAANTELFME
jgi:hypothetical protein